MRRQIQLLRVAPAISRRALTAGLVGLLAIFDFDGQCAAQTTQGSRTDSADTADPTIHAAADDQVEPGAAAAWLGVDVRRRFAGVPGLPGWAGAFYPGDAGHPVALGAGWLVAQGIRWRASVGFQIEPLFGADRIDAMVPGGVPLDRLGEAVIPSPFGMLMSPIATSHPAFHRYTELTLGSRDVLVAGDRLTLQAGSDLHFVLQEMGMASWASDAAAMIGWRTRLKLCWSRPSAFGDFSLEARVDRRADQLGRGQVEMRWQGHL